MLNNVNTTIVQLERLLIFSHLASGRKHESRLPVKARCSNVRDKPRPPATSELARNDSLSSLSLDSFGSTDREIFEETVKAGVSSVNPRAGALDSGRSKAHSVERPVEPARYSRQHKSLDRSDKLAQKPRTRDFERNVAPAFNAKASNRTRRPEPEFAGLSLTRSPYSYHGDGPASLPGRPRDRSNSLSSLSNDSFGSTDKEVFERCVRAGMAKPQPRRREERPRGRSDDRLDQREGREARRRKREARGALERMVGAEYSQDRAILEEVIARGAGERPLPKNVPPPSAARAPAGEHAAPARDPKTLSPVATGSDRDDSAFDLSADLDKTEESAPTEPQDRGEAPTVDSGNTTLESTFVVEMDRSNECLAPKSANTTLDSEVKDELNRSNESYADVLDGSWSDGDSGQIHDAGTLTRKNKNRLEWNDIKLTERPVQEDASKMSTDTWNDNTCPDDVTFPTISGSVHMISSMRSEVADPAMALPDLLEKSDNINMSSSRPDLTNKLDEENTEASMNLPLTDIKLDRDRLLENVPEPSFISLVDDCEQKLDSLMASAIEREAARLAAQLKSSSYVMETSVTSLTSLDLDHVKPPSNLGSLLSLSASGQWDECSAQTSKKSHKSRKKSLPVALMVKRALSNSMHHGSSEHLDSNPVSFLDNVKPPSEMEHIDMESSMVSVSSIVSEVVEFKEKVVFDFNQPIQDFPLCNTFNTVFQDLDKVNPPSLFDEMAESTVEIEQTTVNQVYDDCVSTLNVVTDIPSGSENCTPLPSDVSSVESTPKRQRSNYLTPKEKRHISKDRYHTYTITDAVTENENLVMEVESEEFLTWTKSESDKSDDYVTATSEFKSRRRVSAKQRRQEDRARYQTQTVDINNILTQGASQAKVVDPQIESLKQRLAAKKTMKQKRMEDAERFRTRTFSVDIPPSPTFVTKDANFENVETTTGYDSLSSNEPNHQQLLDDRPRDDDVSSRDADSGHNDDDFELNSAKMQTYTKSFRNYLPVIESPTAVDLCVVNNLKNIEMTASYRKNDQSDKNNPSSSDFASYEGDSNSEDKAQSESDAENPMSRPKPKIIKPENRRDLSLDSNESVEQDEAPKAVRGRKKAMYVSPYRRNPPARKPAATPAKPTPKITPIKGLANPAKAYTSAKTPSKPSTSKAPSANTSPKKSLPSKSPTKIGQQKVVAIPLVAAKPLPLERQGTFTKEESTVAPKDLPMPDRKCSVPRAGKASTPTKPGVTTSPSRLPQLNRYSRPTLTKSNSNPKQTKFAAVKRSSEPAIKSSTSNHSLQSNDSGKTVTLTKASRQGSTSSVNSQSSKTNAKDVESRIASLWKKVEQTKTQPKKQDKRVWIESDKTEPPRLIRSSTFEGQPKQSQMSTAPKQKSAIGMKVSQIPSLRPKSTPARVGQGSPSKKPTNSRVFARKPVNGQVTSQ